MKLGVDHACNKEKEMCIDRFKITSSFAVQHLLALGFQPNTATINRLTKLLKLKQQEDEVVVPSEINIYEDRFEIKVLDEEQDPIYFTSIMEVSQLKENLHGISYSHRLGIRVLFMDTRVAASLLTSYSKYLEERAIRDNRGYVANKLDAEVAAMKARALAKGKKTP